MPHWADDQVVVALRRVPGAQMDVGALQEATGLGPADMEACLTGLRADGIIREDGGTIAWVSDDQEVEADPEIEDLVAAAQNGAEPYREPVRETARDETPIASVPVSPDVTVSLRSALNVVVSAVNAGDPVMIRAEVTMTQDGRVLLIHRIMGISLEP